MELSPLTSEISEWSNIDADEYIENGNYRLATWITGTHNSVFIIDFSAEIIVINRALIDTRSDLPSCEDSKNLLYIKLSRMRIAVGYQKIVDDIEIGNSLGDCLADELTSLASSLPSSPIGVWIRSSSFYRYPRPSSAARSPSLLAISSS